MDTTTFLPALRNLSNSIPISWEATAVPPGLFILNNSTLISSLSRAVFIASIISSELAPAEPKRLVGDSALMAPLISITPTVSGP